jgi:polysaccharide pyruvyl transferase WcaK-like protein
MLCIVTIYRNENPGSALQAYALQSVLSSFGNKVFFCKNTSPGHTIRGLILRIASPVARLRFKLAFLRLHQFYSYTKTQQLFISRSPKKLKKASIDCFILGSDTIWDIKEKRLKYLSQNWGFSFAGRKIISYAASAENTSSELLAHNGIVIGSLDHIQQISVRDEHTKNLIQPLTTKPVVIVCDPTLLLSVEDYGIFANKAPLKEKYILIYIYEKLSNTAITELNDFTKRLNLKTVYISMSFNNAKSFVIPKDPWTFITYYKHADYIITDTFHGSVFSIIFQKQFISVQRGKNKVNDLLTRLQLTHRYIEDIKDMISILERPIDWTSPNAILSEWREQSKRFLCNALAESGKKEE